MRTDYALVGAVATAVVVSIASKLFARRVAAQSARRVLVAVSGTIQDGFELRKNINYSAPGEPTVEALLIGYAVVRGVKMFFDVKNEGCREYDPAVPHRVNPAMVLTGNRLDANQYAIYLVDERACLNALLGEPRLLTMVPDAVRVCLDDKDTSPAVAALACVLQRSTLAPRRCSCLPVPLTLAVYGSTRATEHRRAFIAADGKANTSECAVLAVVPCYQARSFVAAPPVETRADGSRLTSFRASLATFAGLSATASEPGTSAWNGAVANALAAHRDLIASGRSPAPPPTSADRDDSLYGTDMSTARISRRLTAAEFNAVAAKAALELRAV